MKITDMEGMKRWRKEKGKDQEGRSKNRKQNDSSG